MFTQHLPKRRGDGTFGQDARGQLIQKRLENVVVGSVYERDVNRDTSQELSREKPAESAPHYYHLMTVGFGHFLKLWTTGGSGQIGA